MNTQMVRLLLACFILLAGCSALNGPAPTPAHLTLTPTPTPTQEPMPVGRLAVSVLYPTQDSKVDMGQSIKFIVQVADAQGAAVSDAQVTITLRDPNGQSIASIPTVSDGKGAFRTDLWAMPHRVPEGIWSVSAEAQTDSALGNATSNFKVVGSTSDVLLSKYGFWLDAPAWGGMVPQLDAEKGDAQNGLIRWGVVVPGQHVMQEYWVEIQWREGDYGLTSPEAARQFLREQAGDLGYPPVRDIGLFQPTQFKRWDAWQAPARGQFEYTQVEWVAFYAPEVGKTYAIGTTAILPPSSIDPHAALRESFDVFPDIHTAGIAPKPLPRLLPGPELISPPLGTRFLGVSQPIVLQWKPVKELAQDEYYAVMVDYNYKEGNPAITLTTQQTQITLPETLYRTPNCHVFNWQVTLMRQTGIDADGQLRGEPISYKSLYWYVEWRYPPEEEEPYILACPNAQF
jgi:MG2 domain